MAKAIPFEFILEALERLDLNIKPMFGAYGVYLEGKILFILRKKDKQDLDTGMWLCIPDDLVVEVKKEFPILKDLTLFGKSPTAWQVLRETDPDFEEAALKFCELIKKRDPRIGRIPKVKAFKKKKKGEVYTKRRSGSKRVRVDK